MSASSADQKQFKRMTEAPVRRLILKLAVPTTVSMLVTGIYNTADTYFVSQLGKSQSAAVGVVFSLMALIQAIGFTIGMGSGSIISRLIGAKNGKDANVYSSSALVLSFTLGTAAALLGLIFQDSIITKFGATDTILPYARNYARYIFIGTPFMATSFVMNNQLRFQGKARYGMLGLTTGGILNIGLDPLFIFGLDMGISGAAIATLISQCISFSILLSMFLRKKTITVLSPKYMSCSFRVYSDIFTTGLPSMFRQGLGSLAMIFLNTQAKFFGAADQEIINLVTTPSMPAEEIANAASDAAIAAMAITINEVTRLLIYQPVCGMNYGAGKYDRLKDAFMFLLKITTLLMAVFAAAVFIFAPQIASFFRDSPAVIHVASFAMRCQALALPLNGLIFASNMTLQTTGRKRSASFTSILRQGLFYIPLLLILHGHFGITGIQAAQRISDTLTALTSLPFRIFFSGSSGISHFNFRRTNFIMTFYERCLCKRKN